MGYSTTIAQSDTLRLNDVVVSTFANEDCGKVDFPNELATTDVDKQGNGLLALNPKGLIAELETRLVMAESDDQYLNSLLAQQLANSPTIITAVFVKNFADQNGNVRSVQISLQGGILVKAPMMIISANGNIEQTVAIWKLRFGNWSRQIL